MPSLEGDKPRVVERGFVLGTVDDVQAGGSHHRVDIGLSKMGEGGEEIRVSEEEFIYVDIDDAFIPFEQAVAELPDCSGTALIVLRRTGDSDPVDLAERVCRTVR
ncbi:hypothetical protein GCM10007868_12620 [Gluconobacter frateurii]|uniref:PRC-barrel domain-containing protein n=1 Tax=Gluconobacter frateurii NRIC 0228 TaxID=1307946 RepID=A0ABQ0QDJ4_9PROT|nr:hypothetical protein AA0228_2390 [Gluconobacter frateurii NRIC 0228]GLP90187.1 hypothetical protein GCM10007868_12620 [Gluconobacter frateurii]